MTYIWYQQNVHVSIRDFRVPTCYLVKNNDVLGRNVGVPLVTRVIAPCKVECNTFPRIQTLMM